MKKSASRSTSSSLAFTIVELLVATSILTILIAMFVNMVTATSKTWKSTSSKIEEFRSARDAFDTITRHLAQATLSPYLDYGATSAAQPNLSYIRQSQLRFLSGPYSNILSSLALPTTNPSMAVFFQAPNGFASNSNNTPLVNALNTWGYYLDYASDTNSGVSGRPTFVTAKPRVRYRLMELIEPTENLSVYNYTTNLNYTNVDWVSNSLVSGTNAHVVAENIIALILLPKLAPADQATNVTHPAYTYFNSSLAPYYSYDSSKNQNSANINQADQANLNTHSQLPPVIQVTMVAIDEPSVIKFSNAYANLYSSPSSASPPGISDLFTNSANFTNDLQALQGVLNTNHVNYRVFSTDVMIKAAKWSGSQTN